MFQLLRSPKTHCEINSERKNSVRSAYKQCVCSFSLPPPLSPPNDQIFQLLLPQIAIRNQLSLLYIMCAIAPILKLATATAKTGNGSSKHAAVAARWEDFFFFFYPILFYYLRDSTPAPALVVAPIRRHRAGSSSPPSPLRCVPCIHRKKSLVQHFLDPRRLASKL